MFGAAGPGGERGGNGSQDAMFVGAAGSGGERGGNGWCERISGIPAGWRLESSRRAQARAVRRGSRAFGSSMGAGRGAHSLQQERGG